LNALQNNLKGRNEEVRLIVAPTFSNLYPACQALKDAPISVAAQNMHQKENGAFTGEVSAAMLKSVGVETVILGHSERRKYFAENNALLAEKADAALAHDLDIIFCIGESLEERESNRHFEIIKNQLREVCFIFQKLHGRISSWL